MMIIEHVHRIIGVIICSYHTSVSCISVYHETVDSSVQMPGLQRNKKI